MDNLFWHSSMRATGVKNLLHLGVHTNWCVWGRGCGVRNVSRDLNVRPILIRDLTDAYTANGKHPDAYPVATDDSWYPDRGTREVVAWYEQNAWGTIDAGQLLALDAADRYDYTSRVRNENGLVAYWRMSGKNGYKQVQDVMTTQNAWNSEKVSLGQRGAVPGDPDTCAKFDGTAGVIVAPRYQGNLPSDAPQGNSPLVSLSSRSFSVEAWVQVDALPKSESSWVFSHDAGTDATVDVLLGVNPDGRFRFITRQGSNDLSSSIAVTSQDVKNNKWFHIVGLQDTPGGKVELYVNGQLVAKKTGVDGTAPTVPSSAQIGSRGATAVAGNGTVTSSGIEFFTGLIDEVAVYIAPLTGTQIREHYICGTASGDASPKTGVPNGSVRTEQAEPKRPTTSESPLGSSVRGKTEPPPPFRPSGYRSTRRCFSKPETGNPTYPPSSPLAQSPSVSLSGGSTAAR